MHCPRALLTRNVWSVLGVQTQGVFLDLVHKDARLASTSRAGLESFLSILRERVVEVVRRLRSSYRRARRAKQTRRDKARAVESAAT